MERGKIPRVSASLGIFPLWSGLLSANTNSLVTADGESRSASLAEDEEAVSAAPRPGTSAQSSDSSVGRYSLTGVCAIPERGKRCRCRQLQQGRGTSPLGTPGPCTDGPALATVSRVSGSVIQSVTPSGYRKTFAAAEPPPQPLSAGLISVFRGHGMLLATWLLLPSSEMCCQDMCQNRTLLARQTALV